MPSASQLSPRVVVRHLDAGQGHRVALATAGDPRLPAVLIVHGGPGSGSRLGEPLLFDPARHFLVWVDQRGCGGSRPRGSLRRNTTALLVRDFDRVREHFGLQRWAVYGGSWGAALALAYSAAHPQRVRALLLRGTYLTARRDTARFFLAGRRCAPRAWRALLRASGATRGDRLFHCCATVSRLGTLEARLALGLAWSRYEGAMLAQGRARHRRISAKTARDIADKYRLQAHYLVHACWLGREGLRRCAIALRDAPWPALAVHGRRDRVCPSRNLRVLHEWLPRLRTQSIDAGHRETEAPMLGALRRGLQELLRDG